MPLPTVDLTKPVFTVMPMAAIRIASGKCGFCGEDVNEQDFTDALSLKEYGISGMCQKCQNDVFGGSDED